MNRIAIIIRGHSRDDEELAADQEYVNYYYTFLSSIAGGAWENKEIIILEEPSFKIFSEMVKRLKPEYAVMIFIGHGTTQEDHQLFQLNKEIIIKPGQFTFEINKQLVIIESCRTDNEGIPWTDLENKLPEYRYGGYVGKYKSQAQVYSYCL